MDNKTLLYMQRRAHPSTVWLLFLFLGWSYGSLGKIGIQLLWYFIAFFPLWGVISLFFGTLGAALSEGTSADAFAALGASMLSLSLLVSMLFGMWWLFRLLTLHGAIKAYNQRMAVMLGLTHDEMVMVGALG